MEPWVSALIQLGVAGIGLYLFVRGILQSKPTVDERLAAAEARRVAELTGAEQRRKAERDLLEARIREGDGRNAELRADRDAWRKLAIGTEARLDKVPPTLVAVAAATGAPIPSVPPIGEAG